MRSVLKELPGIGWELSARVEQYANEREAELKDLSQWYEADWQEVDGIGKGLSRQLVEAWGWKSDQERK